MKRTLLLATLVLAVALLFSGCIVIEEPEPIHDLKFTGERVKEGFQDVGGIYYNVYSDATAEVTGINTDVVTGNSLAIPETCGHYTVVAILDQAFENATLTSVTLPDTLERIGDRAFRGSGIRSLVLPDRVTEVGEDAFDHCRDLVKADLGEGLKVLPTGMFFGCHSLKEVVLPSKLEVIGEESFSDCESLEKIALPETLREIGPYAFWNSGTEDLDFAIPDGVAVVGAAAFRGTAWLKRQSEEFVVVGDGVLLRYNGEGTEVVIPEGIRYLADAFAGTAVEKVTLPQTYTGECTDAWEETRVTQVIPAN